MNTWSMVDVNEVDEHVVSVGVDVDDDDDGSRDFSNPAADCAKLSGVSERKAKR